MLKKYQIHKEGYKIIIFSSLFLLGINLLIRYLAVEDTVLQIVAGSISAVLLLAIVAFFRIPNRILNPIDDVVIAPADGKIVAIEEVKENEYFKDNRIQVSIFMSPANAHVNRNPIDGIVKYIKYHPGKYLVAWHPKSSVKNEHNSVVIEQGDFAVLVRQIAGKLARRIVNYLEEGDIVHQNSELGFIKFGSRVDVFLPLNTEINVALKQKVKAGKTIIGKIIKED